MTFLFLLRYSHCYSYNPAIQPRCTVVLGVISTELSDHDVNRMFDVLAKVCDVFSLNIVLSIFYRYLLFNTVLVLLNLENLSQFQYALPYLPMK